MLGEPRDTTAPSVGLNSQGAGLAMARQRALDACATRAITWIGVEGVTAVPQDAIARLTQGLTGPAISESRIEAARQAIVDLHRAHGFIYVTVNAFLTDSSLHLMVTDGYVGDVNAGGDTSPEAPTSGCTMAATDHPCCCCTAIS